MSQAELVNRIAERVRQRESTISEIAVEMGQPEENIRPAIAMLKTEGLVRQEGDYFCTRFADPSQPSSASVQNSDPVSQQAGDSQTQGTTDVHESAARGQQGSLITKFMAALKAAQEAEASILLAEKSSCVRHHRLGKVAIELKVTFARGEWGKFLQKEKVDQNRINRAMRIATYLTVSQCERLPILAAERLIKKIRDYRREHGANPSTSRLTDMVIEATMDYENGRLQQAKKAGESAVVDLVDPQIGHFYQHKNGKVYRVTQVTEDALVAVYPGGGEEKYPHGCDVTEKLVSFCADVVTEVTKEEFDNQMAAWMKTIEDDRRNESEVVQNEAPPRGTAPVESKADERIEDAQTETAPVTSEASATPKTAQPQNEFVKEAEEVPAVAEAGSGETTSPSASAHVLDEMVGNFKEIAYLFHGSWDRTAVGTFVGAVTDEQAEAYEALLVAANGDPALAAMIAIVKYLEAHPESDEESDIEDEAHEESIAGLAEALERAKEGQS